MGRMKKFTKDQVRAVFVDEDHYSWREIHVTITPHKDSTSVTVSQMYEYLPLQFTHIMKLAELFGTTDFIVNQWHSNGCETCDYRSQYTHEFEVPHT